MEKRQWQVQFSGRLKHGNALTESPHGNSGPASQAAASEEKRVSTERAAAQGLAIDALVALCRDTLSGLVAVETYEFASCYLWYDRPLYNEFGDEIRRLRGDTIYLQRDGSTPLRDLFHELGHVVGRHCRQVGNSENGYRGEWDGANEKLIAEIGAQRHWSAYLNRFAQSQHDFHTNAASETWAELFMLWHLYPYSAEAALLDPAMTALRDNGAYRPVARLAERLDLGGG